MIETLQKCIDTVADYTGLRHIRDVMWPASAEGEVTLEVPGYAQLDSFSCGATTGFMVVKTFHPHIQFDNFYNMVCPDQIRGTSTRRLVSALRGSGVGVRILPRLTFAGVRQSIDAGFPMITDIMSENAECAHWVVIYGYGVKPSRVFIAVNGLPIFNRKRIPWADFSTWCNSKSALVCWGK